MLYDKILIDRSGALTLYGDILVAMPDSILTGFYIRGLFG